MYAERAESPSLSRLPRADSALFGRDERPDDEEIASFQRSEGSITLHSTEGLKFPRVSLVGLERGDAFLPPLARARRAREPQNMAWRTSASRGR